MDNKPEKVSGAEGVLLRVANAAPYGIIAGACAIVVFFATVGIIVAYFVLGGIAGATGATVTIFDNWWQVLLFVADIIFFVGFIASLALFVIRVVLNRVVYARMTAARNKEENNA